MSIQLGNTALGAVPLALGAGVVYFMTRKGRGLGKITKGFKAGSGVFANAAEGIGVKAIINVADKMLLGGKATSMGISFPVMGKTIGVNLTDLAAYFMLNGFSFGKGTLKRAATQLIPAKVFEMQNWIDPPLPAIPNPQGNAQYAPAFVAAPQTVRTVN